MLEGDEPSVVAAAVALLAATAERDEAVFFASLAADGLPPADDERTLDCVVEAAVIVWRPLALSMGIPEAGSSIMDRCTAKCDPTSLASAVRARWEGDDGAACVPADELGRDEGVRRVSLATVGAVAGAVASSNAR